MWTCYLLLKVGVSFVPHLSVSVVAKESCEEVLEQLKESLEMLSEYTERMEREMKEREEIEELLDSFIWKHQCLLHKAKERQKVILKCT